MSQLVVFTIGGDAYGLPIRDVQEIIRHTPPRAIPSTGRAVEGVINLRSRIIPVCDLRTMLDLEPAPLPQPGDELDAEAETARKTIVLESSHGPIGLVVDAVDRVLEIDDDAVDANPASDTLLVSGIVEVEGALLLLLDPEQLADAFALAGGKQAAA